MPNDPRFERALEEFFFSERLSRRRFIGRPARPGSPSAASPPCSPPAAASRAPRSKSGGDAEKKAAKVSHPKTEIGDWTFSNWPLYIDKAVIKDFNQEYGGKCKYVEEINDNFEFFGKIRQPLEQGADRPRHRHA